MPLGLGLGELVLALVFICIPAALLFAGARAILRAMDRRQAPRELEATRPNAELEDTQRRLGELEAKLARVDEKASVAEDRVEKPGETR